LKAGGFCGFRLCFPLSYLGSGSIRCFGGGLGADVLRMPSSLVLLPCEAFYLLPLSLDSLVFLQQADTTFLLRGDLATDRVLLGP